VRLAVRSGTHGRGTFTEEPIAAGERILAFSGPHLRHAQTSASTLALQIGPDLYVGESGGPDDFVNHSCEPNAWVRIDGTSAELRALRDIAPGEEILFDYSTTLDEDDFTMECRCGAPSCRRVVGDGKDLPAAVWERYEALGILPEYVRRSRAGSTPSSGG
jgi:SET domain-containing protein